MPGAIGRYDSGEVAIPPNDWKTLSIDGTDLLTGASRYTAAVLLSCVATAGSTVMGRYYHLRPDGSRWQSGIVERVATPGTSFLDFPHMGSIAADERLRFEVSYHPPEGDTAPMVISAARARGLYWKA